jgi:hypothetical protein
VTVRVPDSFFGVTDSVSFPTPAEVRKHRTAVVANLAKELAQTVANTLPNRLPEPDGSYRISMDSELSPDVYAAFQGIVGAQWDVLTERPKLSHGDKLWWLILTPRQPEPGEAAP